MLTVGGVDLIRIFGLNPGPEAGLRRSKRSMIELQKRRKAKRRSRRQSRGKSGNGEASSRENSRKG
ncbi:hypothetical protein RP20_CCG002173 [Aedes albopictus]|nr:hypothetical protein RP20_CCG002173 [Aedes albopictus]